MPRPSTAPEGGPDPAVGDSRADGTGTGSRWSWRNWSVLTKLIAVLLVPTSVAIVLGAIKIADDAQNAPDYERLGDISEVQSELSALMGQVQTERDLATDYVAHDRRLNPSTYQDQFARTDAAADAVREAAEGVDDLGATLYQDRLESVNGLKPLRQGVLNGSDPVAVVISEYGAAIDPLLALDDALSRQLDDVAVAGSAAARSALMAAREQVTQQHAVLIPALLANEFRPEGLEAMQAADIRLKSELQAFEAALSPAERSRYVGPVTGSDEQSRQRMLKLVLSRAAEGVPLATPTLTSDERAAAVVGQMNRVEGELSGDIADTSDSLASDARSDALRNSILLFLVLALGFGIGVLIARSLLRPLKILRSSALDVADNRLPEAVASVRAGTPPAPIQPVPVHTREEVGQVARAFDVVHAEAVRLAAEQAQLRSNVNDMFMNLSRRSQGLVQRQLKLIDRLENREENPEVLDSLFQLDHLATRMRRNNENLLVLAGAESGRRSSKPVLLVDVLRAAVSEVEHYQRVVVQPPPRVLVRAAAAGDLVHVLSELLDNATGYSPPDSSVVVSAETTADGAVRLEIEDRGVGISKGDLDEINRRLADPPAVDPSVSRRMGLFVVARLAGRHDIAVQLRTAAHGVGTVATVTLPPDLVPVADDSTGSPSGAPRASAPSQADADQAVPAQATSVGAAANGLAGGAGVSNGNGTAPGNGLNTGDRELPKRRPRPAPASTEAAQGVPPAEAAPAPASGSEPLPTRTPARPPQPATAAASGSAGDLFRATPAEVAPTRPKPRTLDERTPIFDDVANAWFRESKPVPVQWAGPTDTEMATAVAGRVVAEEWGVADEGWRAAAAAAPAAAEPGAGELTGAGLPRRRAQAQLVPGAAPAARPSGGAPARDAEAIRGRLSAYQRGVAQGRHVRNSGAAKAGDQGGRHTAGEEQQ